MVTKSAKRLHIPCSPPTSYSPQSDPSIPRFTSIDNPYPSSPSDDSVSLSHHLYPTPFTPTHKLQIQAYGKALWDFPTPGSLDPIPIFDVTNGQSVHPGDMPLYISSRNPERTRTTQLIRTSGAGLTGVEVARTHYTFALARTPRIELLDTSCSVPPTPLVQTPGVEGVSATIDPAISVIAGTAAARASAGITTSTTHEISVQNKKILHRGTVMRTHLGTFEWRYASKNERQRDVPGADSLLLFEKVARVVGDLGKEEEMRRLVGRLVRSEETRTPGTGASTAGNGGLLEVDVGEWGGSKEEMEEMRVIAITSCLTMLKKEVDRRRAHQIMVLSGGGGVIVL